MSEINVPVFHAREGLHFGRLPNGDVFVWLKTDDQPNGAGPRIVLDAATWASVVAAVSVHGDHAEYWQAALDFHSGTQPRIDFDPRTALGPEHRATLAKMADDVQKSRDDARNRSIG